MTPPRPRPYRLFEVTGVELEYAIVGPDLRPRSLVEETFRRICGRSTSSLEYRRVGFSNEFASHMLEIKNVKPHSDPARMEAALVDGLRYFAGVLRHNFGARLLPTGMHPLMLPCETALWPRAGKDVFRAYAQVFPVWDHGWLNVQSCQVNLPFGSERQTVALHNAVACLLPYLPALTASSPIYEGRPGPCVDNRLFFYRTNQQSIPEITGLVVPEFMTSYGQYRREVLRPIYRALERTPAGGRLRYEWVNSRGAILRFDRRAIEIRVLDTQECVKMDIAAVVFVRGVLKSMVRGLQSGALALPGHAMLVRDLDAVIRRGTRAPVGATHLRPPSRRSAPTVSARVALLGLLDAAAGETPPAQYPYLALVEKRLRAGNLSERILRALGRGMALRSVYGELMDCLESNTPWER